MTTLRKYVDLQCAPIPFFLWFLSATAIYFLTLTLTHLSWSAFVRPEAVGRSPDIYQAIRPAIREQIWLPPTICDTDPQGIWKPNLQPPFENESQANPVSYRLEVFNSIVCLVQITSFEQIINFKKLM